MTLDEIELKFKDDVNKFVNEDILSDELFDALYDHYSMSGEMPYGVAKARDGDPYEWVAERFEKDSKDFA